MRTKAFLTALCLTAATAALACDSEPCEGDSCDELAEDIGDSADNGDSADKGDKGGKAKPCEKQGGVKQRPEGGDQVVHGSGWYCKNKVDWWQEWSEYGCNDGTQHKIVTKDKKSNPETDVWCPRDPATACAATDECDADMVCAMTPDEDQFRCLDCGDASCGELDPGAIVFGWASTTYASAADCNAALADGIPMEVLDVALVSLLADAERVCGAGNVASVTAYDDGGAYYPTCGTEEGGSGPILGLDVVGYAICL